MVPRPPSRYSFKGPPLADAQTARRLVVAANQQRTDGCRRPDSQRVSRTDGQTDSHQRVSLTPSHSVRSDCNGSTDPSSRVALTYALRSSTEPAGLNGAVCWSFSLAGSNPWTVSKLVRMKACRTDLSTANRRRTSCSSSIQFIGHCGGSCTFFVQSSMNVW
eukprot:Selendium_serpulae@DN7681_c0_g1_i1.p1